MKLNIYASEESGEAAYIVGDREALKALHVLVAKALLNNSLREPLEATDSTGASYGVFVICVDESKLKELMHPYASLNYDANGRKLHPTHAGHTVEEFTKGDST